MIIVLTSVKMSDHKRIRSDSKTHAIYSCRVTQSTRNISRGKEGQALKAENLTIYQPIV
jgi:hypothetical protein